MISIVCREMSLLLGCMRKYAGMKSHDVCNLFQIVKETKCVCACVCKEKEIEIM